MDNSTLIITDYNNSNTNLVINNTSIFKVIFTNANFSLINVNIKSLENSKFYSIFQI